MHIAFLMDPLESVKAEKDTSYILMLAAFERGHDVYHISPKDLELVHDQVRSRVKKVKVNKDIKKPFEVLEESNLFLDQIDVIWVRTDPPFDRSYFYTTLMLDRSQSRIINRPSSLRDWNEKLSVLNFPQFTPNSIVSSDKNSILDFIKSEEKVALKPIDGFGGRGIHLVSSEDKNLEKIIDEATHKGSHKIVGQAFVKEADAGDKRILLVDGEPIGAVLRKANEPGKLNNLDQGGEALPAELTEREKEICSVLKPHLQELGLFFVGIDMLGDYLTEINVTSPTGLQELIRFSGVDHHHEIIKRIEE